VSRLNELDAPRVGFVLIGVLIAALAAIAVWQDDGMAGRQLATQIFVVEAVALTFLALWPSGGEWSPRRRRLTARLDTASVVAGLVIVVFVGARAACGCGDPTTGYQLPTLFTIPSTTWLDIGTFGVPIVVTIAASRALDRDRSGAGVR
jgi:hypothetical protein